jgi:hypothetical protein
MESPSFFVKSGAPPRAQPLAFDQHARPQPAGGLAGITTPIAPSRAMPPAGFSQQVGKPIVTWMAVELAAEVGVLASSVMTTSVEPQWNGTLALGVHCRVG